MEGATGDDQHLAARGMTVQDREATLLQAVSQGRWQRAVVLVQHGVSSSLRDTTLLRAAESKQWGCVLDVLRLGASPEARAAVFLMASQRDQWDCVSDILHLGVLRSFRDDVFLIAAKNLRWDCAGKLFDLGVSAEKRDLGFSDVVDGGDARLSSDLIAAGVSQAMQERVLRGAIEQGRVAFVVELLRLTDMASVGAFVLDTAVSLQDWTLLFEVVKLHGELQLSAQQMDTACGAAVSGLQWDCVLFLLEKGVEPTLDMVKAVFMSDSDVVERFLGIFQRETISSTVKRILIEGAIWLDDGVHILQSILRRYGASEKEIMFAFDLAVDGRNGDALSVLVNCANRNSKLLKEFCHAKTRAYSPQILSWICLNLKDRNIVLSLDIALTFDCNVFANILLCDETSRKVRRIFLQKVCFCRNDLFKLIANQLIVKYPQYRRTLFLMSVRQGCSSVALKLYGQGVSLGDVKYAISVAIATDCDYWYSDEELVDNFTLKLNREDRSKVMKWLVRESLDYFVSTGEEAAEFLAWFEFYCTKKEAETRFVVSAFSQAYKTAVTTGNVKCFVESINLVMGFSRKIQSRGAQTRGTVSHNVFEDPTNKAVAAIDFALKKKKFRFLSEAILVKNKSELNACILKRSFLKGEWLVFDMLFEIKAAGSFAYYGQEFMHCLSRTVVMVSDTPTVGASGSKSDTLNVGASESDTLTVGASDILTVGAGETLTVGASDILTVGAGETLTVGASDVLTVGASDSKSDTLNVGASDSESIAPTVGASDILTVGASDTPTVGASDILTDGASESDTPALHVGSVRVLNKWLSYMCLSQSSQYGKDAGRVLDKALGVNFKLSQQSGVVLGLAEFSSRHGCHSLALFLTLVLGAEGRELMERVVHSHLDSVNHNLVFELASYTCRILKNTAVAAFLVKNLPLGILKYGPMTIGYATERVIPMVRCQGMIPALRQVNAFQWVLVSQLVLDQNLAEAEQTLTLCDSRDSACADVLVEHAADHERWDLVGKYMSKACSSDLLEWLLTMALECCRSIDASVQRRLVNLAGTSPKNSAEPQLMDAMILHFEERSYKRPRVVNMARCLVSLGASAQQRREEGSRNTGCPMKRVCRLVELRLVKLFHRSGVCSNRRLYQLASDSHGSGFFASRWDCDVDKKSEAIQSYLSFAASCPLSLQDLCRHTVSSCLGGQPGYLQRVQALPVPQPVKEFILYSDLVEEESEGQTGE